MVQLCGLRTWTSTTDHMCLWPPTARLNCNRYAENAVRLHRYDVMMKRLATSFTPDAELASCPYRVGSDVWLDRRQVPLLNGDVGP